MDYNNLKSLPCSVRQFKEGTMGIQLQRFACHFVDKASNYINYSENEKEIGTLNITIIDFNSLPPFSVYQGLRQ